MRAQGLVLLLALVACGVPIASTTAKSVGNHSLQGSSSNVTSGSGDYFPEEEVRKCASGVLSRLSLVLAAEAELQERVLLALLHTQNTCTRGNIFAGLVFLSATSAVISE